MPVVAIRKSQWDAGNGNQADVLKFATATCELGVPAVYKSGNTQWCVFHSVEIVLGDAASLGAAAKEWQASRNRPVPKGQPDERREFVESLIAGSRVPVSEVQLTEVVQVEVPVYEWVEVVDPETGETYTVRRDTGETQLVDQEQSLGDPFVLVLAAQSGVPPWIQCFTELPGSWVPVEGIV